MVETSGPSGPEKQAKLGEGAWQGTGRTDCSQDHVLNEL